MKPAQATWVMFRRATGSYRMDKPLVRSPCMKNRAYIHTSSAKSLDVRARAKREDDVLRVLRSVNDPILDIDVVKLGYVKNLTVDNGGEAVSFTLQLPTPVHRFKQQMLDSAQQSVAALDWCGAVDAKTSSKRPSAPSESVGKGLKSVANIIGVSSCKGGTGKSTVTVNLAYTLSQLGARVGIFDADVYGPSLHSLVSPEDTAVYKDEDNGTINPLEYEGVKLMSYGWVAPRDKVTGERSGAVVRGPIASNIVQQMSNFTDWGELDYLLVDLPPGTGDINLTLCQQLQMTAAVVVTTPHNLSYIDVVKGIDMMTNLKVPPLAVVENMAYFQCDHGTKYSIFGDSSLDKLIAEFGFKATAQLPLSQKVAAASNANKPFVLGNMEHPVAQAYTELGLSLAAEVLSCQVAAAKTTVDVAWDARRGQVMLRQYSVEAASEVGMDPAKLRRACKCAECVDEFSGLPLLDPSAVPDDVTATSIQRKGNYAVAIAWSDGHTSSIYTFDDLRTFAQASA